MNLRVLIAAGCIAVVSVATTLHAADSRAFLSAEEGTSAVDVKGIRHTAARRSGKLDPWLEERVKTIAPQYPYGERARHHEGRGYFQLTLDPKTGLVTKVAVIKSTGFPVLDNSATSALRQWKWKRGRWKEIDMPVTFEIREPTVPLPKGAIPLPNG